MNIYFAALGACPSVLIGRVLKQNGRVLNKLDEGFGKMDEGFRMMGTKMDEGFKLIAQLIVEKNDQTKREILDALAKK